MHKKLFTFLIGLLSTSLLLAQDSIQMQVKLNPDMHSLEIKQKTLYTNTSTTALNSIFFHDWPNAFSDKNTPLGKRFVENYKNKFFFAREKDKGYTTIHNIVIKNQTTTWQRPNADALEIALQKPLLPNKTIAITISYTVKIPHSKFTNYGVKDNVFNLRYWYLVPFVYTTDWQYTPHLNMDDLYQNTADYNIQLTLPKQYHVASNLEIKLENNGIYTLTGTNTKDIELYISQETKFENFQTDAITVSTNLDNIAIGNTVKKDILNRQFIFLNEKLGQYPHDKIFVNSTSYTKNPLYGFSQLPSFLRPFSDTFEWDLRMLKTLTKYYISGTLNQHTRKDVWLQEALQSYLMMQYVAKYYPEVKLIGSVANIWGVRSYHIADLDYNERYNTAYQYVARANLDQKIDMQTDSLTNFNRLVFAKYKGAMGLQLLDEYIGDSIVHKGIKHFFKVQSQQNNQQDIFKNYIKSATKKEVDWFFDEYIATDKKVDFSFENIVKKNKDSVMLFIKNRTKSRVPIKLYGLKNDSIISQQWISSNQTKITLAHHNADRWVLNLKGTVPETNTLNNFDSSRWRLFKKPINIRWLGDIEDSKKHQIIFEPNVNYNYYDGLAIASNFSNKTFYKKNFKISLTPSYSFKSKSFTGSFGLRYWKHLDNKFINSYRIGISGKYFHYQPNLAYKKLNPYINILFKRKNLRSVKSSSVSASLTMIDKDIDVSQSNTPYNKYNVLSLNYSFSNPEIINNLAYKANLEFGADFSKLSSSIRFRKLTNAKRQFDVRFFAGAFLYNNTTTDFFSYGVNRPNDYSFKYQYFGRSESSGFLSQQIIINDGGFKSQMPVPFANQWITSLNTSVGIWRWFEIYNDVGFAKNRGEKIYFIHDKGLRFNFVNDILEVYFPLHSSNGWEITQPHYEDRIRFVFKANFSSIYNFMRRGFM